MSRCRCAPMLPVPLAVPVPFLFRCLWLKPVPVPVQTVSVVDIAPVLLRVPVPDWIRYFWPSPCRLPVAKRRRRAVPVPDPEIGCWSQGPMSCGSASAVTVADAVWRRFQAPDPLERRSARAAASALAVARPSPNARGSSCSREQDGKETKLTRFLSGFLGLIISIVGADHNLAGQSMSFPL